MEAGVEGFARVDSARTFVHCPPTPRDDPVSRKGDVWLTYAEAGQRLGVSPEAVRAKAIRRGWRRQHGNDGKTRLRLPFEPVDHAGNARSTPVHKSVDPAVVHALEGHVASLKAEIEHRAAEIDALKAQLAGAEARASDEAAKTTQTIAAVEAHNATLKADIEKLEAQLASAEIRASEESAKTAQAIAAFESLAQRLEAMAAARRPLWHRLLWRG